jgi:hypothetical protein
VYKVKSYIGKHPEISELDIEISLLQNKRDNLLYQRDKEHTTSTAFVIFKTQLAAKKIIQYFEIGRLRKIKKDFLVRNRQNTDSFANIRVEGAPEPSDIYWVNLRVNPLKRFIIKLCVYFLLFVALFISFIIINSLNSIKHDDSRIISITGSILLISFNAVLGKLVRLLTQFERHPTWSDYTRSVTNKLCLIVCLNTIIIPFFANNDMDKWYNKGGLAEDIFYVVIANAIIPNLTYILNIPYIIKVLRRWNLQRISSQGQPLNISQARANELYEGPEFDLSSRTAHIVKTFILCIAYSPLVPIAIPISICGLMIEYWISKYMLLRVHTRPRNYGNEMFGNTGRWIQIGLLIHSIMLMVFYTRIVEDTYQSYGYVYIYLAAQYLFCPVESIVDKLRKEDKYAIMENLLKDDEMANNYEKQLPFFYTDYLRDNPVTEVDGWKQWLAALMEREKNKEKKEQLSKLMQRASSKDVDERLHDWRRNHTITPHKRTKRAQYHKKIAEILESQKLELHKSSQISKWGLAIMMIRKRRQEEENRSSLGSERL